MTLTHIFLLCGICSHLFSDHFISFIIPCYNCEPWISSAVESIYEQHLTCPFEILCTDDASTDGTLQILETLQKKHPEITLLRHAENRGGAAARNTSIRSSKGDLLFCLDADNILVPDSVQRLIDRHDETGIDIISFGELHYFNNAMESKGYVLYLRPGDEYTFLDIVQDDQTPPWSGNYLFTRKSYDRAGGYLEEYRTPETFIFGFLQLLTGSRLIYVPGTYYLHRVDNEGFYSRESGAKRLQINFFLFLLSHRKLFTDDSIKILEKQLNLARNRRDFHDQIWILHNKVIELRN